MYQPSQEILDKYADILVNFALNSGKGVKPKEVVFLQVPESAKPLLVSLYQTVLKAGAFPIIQYLPDGLDRNFFELANEDQLKFFPAVYLKARVKQADHFLMIIAETNKHELEGIDPLKIMERNKVLKPYREWREQKENKNKLTWTLALYGTEAMAKEARLSLKQCWNQIIKACYLNIQNPLKKWQEVKDETERLKKKLNNLDIEKLHIKSENTDLIVGVGEKRQWMGGGGRNIPSFEVFVSPDWRQTEGFVYFDQPLYRDGNIIQNIKLTFKSGEIIDVQAKKGENYLKQMIKVYNANKIGEFSLTDKRTSKINKFMAETLFDENYGGKFGNMHLAIGSAYKESFSGKTKLNKVTKEEWEQLGFNESVIHTDIISTENKIVTAFLKNGQKKIIYKNGKFII